MISSIISLQETDSIKLWHYHFGHALTNVLHNAHKTCTGFPLDRFSTFTEVDQFCKGCALVKYTQPPHTPSDSCPASVLPLSYLWYTLISWNYHFYPRIRTNGLLPSLMITAPLLALPSWRRNLMHLLPSNLTWLLPNNLLAIHWSLCVWTKGGNT